MTAPPTTSETTGQTHPFYFEPDSALWRVAKERALLLGGGRALLLQAAHPLVGEAVHEHSYFRERPFQRLRETLNLTYTMAFGTREETLQAAETIKRRHSRVKGELSEAVGPYPHATTYDALDPELGAWVLATLIDGALVGYERFVAPLSEATRQAYYDDLKQVGQLLGVERSLLPATCDGLRDYMHQMIVEEYVKVTDRAREIAPHVLMQKSYLKPPAFPLARISIGLLPPALRQQYGFTFSRTEQTALDVFAAALRRTLPMLPARVRYMPHYRRARKILQQANLSIT